MRAATWFLHIPYINACKQRNPMRRSHQIAQDSCGWRLLLQTPVSIHTQTHSFIVRQAETQTVTRRHAGRWLLPHTARACTRHRRAGIRLRHQQAGAWAWPSFFFISKPMQTHRRGQFGWPAVMAGRSKPEAPYLPGLSHNKQTDRSTGRQDHPSHEQ